MKPLRILKPLPVLAALVALAGGYLVRDWHHRSVELASADPVSARGYAGSASCAACHPDHEASWRRTFHRTMTQEANEKTVLGDFHGAEFDFDGVRSRFLEDHGRFFIEIARRGQPLERDEVVRTVGSRRVQQYVTRSGDRYLRLPLAWNIGEKRWFHLNAGFLSPDGAPFDQHRALWDGNCIFCHNVGANPGYDWKEKRFASHVAELGIGCEACHGPGGEHERLNRDPVRRYLLHATGEPDPTIVNPLRLSAERRLQLCGHCHGQRLPHPIDRIRGFLAKGDPYFPGEDLSAFTEPIFRDSKLAGVDLSLRFWGDGTPRLTAYEYQGLLMSHDFQKGGLTCIDCHSMHAGDPKGMIDPDHRAAAACSRCHADLVAHADAHAHHQKGGNGTRCYACHMPKITYGLLDAHPTHRIGLPDPSRAWRYEMPEACTLCHTDRSAKWAAIELAKQLGRPPPKLPDSPGFDVAESVRALVAGDVVQRAIAAIALGDEDSAEPDPVRRLWAAPFLIETLEDPYAAVRHFAFRSLKARIAAAGRVRPSLLAQAATLPDFEPQAEPAQRARVIAAWRAFWAQLDKRGIARPEAVPLGADWQPRPEVIAQLRSARLPQPLVSIGE